VATWQLQTAKAQLSELLRKVREEGPQTITVRGKEEFVVMRKDDALDVADRVPRTWDELYAPVQGLLDELELPPRVAEPMRDPFRDK
jgi:prevent-host-death family protein